MNTFLKNILLLLCFTHNVSYSSQNLIDQDDNKNITTNYFDQLPNEITQHIFSYIKPSLCSEIKNIRFKVEHLEKKLEELESSSHFEVEDLLRLQEKMKKTYAFYTQNISELKNQLNILSSVNHHWSLITYPDRADLMQHIYDFTQAKVLSLNDKISKLEMNDYRDCVENHMLVFQKNHLFESNEFNQKLALRLSHLIQNSYHTSKSQELGL